MTVILAQRENPLIAISAILPQYDRALKLSQHGVKCIADHEDLDVDCHMHPMMFSVYGSSLTEGCAGRETSASTGK